MHHLQGLRARRLLLLRLPGSPELEPGHEVGLWIAELVVSEVRGLGLVDGPLARVLHAERAAAMTRTSARTLAPEFS